MIDLSHHNISTQYCEEDIVQLVLSDKDNISESREFCSCLYHDARKGTLVPMVLDEEGKSVSCDATQSIDDLIAGLPQQKNYFTSVNTFVRSRRRTPEIFNITGIFIDIDAHTRNNRKRAEILSSTRKVLEMAFTDGTLPAPTMVTDSGRGFGVFYIFDRSIACQTGSAKKQVALYYVVKRALFNAFRQFLKENQTGASADGIATSLAQLCRIPGTFNTKSKTYARLLYHGDYTTLAGLRSALRIQPGSGKTITIREAGKDPDPSFFSMRIRRLEKLCELRAYDCVGYRELMLYIAHQAYLHIPECDDAKMLHQFNNSFARPLSEHELASIIRKGRSRRYRYRDATIRRMLDITDDETKAAGFLSSTKRELTKLQNRKKRAERDMEVIRLYEDKDVPRTQKEIAKIMKISDRTVRRILSSVCPEADKKCTVSCCETSMLELAAWVGQTCVSTGVRLRLQNAISEMDPEMVSVDVYNWIDKTLDSDPAHADEDDLIALTDMLMFNYAAPFADALTRLRTGQNAFVSGAAGTGKSTLLNLYAEELALSGKNVMKLAPSGTAADRLAGFTIHHACHMTPGTYQSDSVIRIDQVRQFADVSCVIVDEAGMMRSDLFRQLMRIIHMAERKYDKQIQVIVSGDFRQTAPVIPEQEQATFRVSCPNESGYIFESPLWTTCGFSENRIVLKKVLRQKDRRFSDLLGRIGDGDCSAVEELNDTVRIDPDAWKNGKRIVLCAYRKDVDMINRYHLSRHKTERIFSADAPEGGRYRVEKDIAVYKGMPVMTVVNTKDYSNGTFGKVRKIYSDRIVITADGGREITVKREKIRSENGTGCICQLPIVPAYAITIHKAQGKTFERAVVAPRCFADGQLYTACSRVKNARGLILLRPAEETDLRFNEKAVAEMCAASAD